MNNSPSLQHMRLVSGFVNAEDNPAVGVPLSSPSGSIVQPYTGMLGGRMFLDDGTALKLSKTSIGTLYAGIYQMVRLKANAVTPARGQLVFWDVSVDYSLFQVTNLESAVPSADLKAGVLVNAMTAGNYGFIQVAGRASLLFRAILSAAGAVGSPVWAAAQGVGADNATADVLADGDPVTVADMPHYLGVAVTAPTNGGVAIVDLAPFNLRQ